MTWLGDRWLHFTHGFVENPHALSMYFLSSLVAPIIQFISNQVLIIYSQLELD